MRPPQVRWSGSTSAYEVAQQIVPELSQDRLGVKLDTLHRQLLVLHSHDFPVVGPRCDFEDFRQRFTLDHQRVVARGLEWFSQSAENTSTAVMNGRHLPVHHPLGMYD